jgi:hypothetical protein
MQMTKPAGGSVEDELGALQRAPVARVCNRRPAARWRERTAGVLLAIAAAVTGIGASSPARADELGFSVFGLSYHFNRDKARQLDVDNGFNPGLGLKYRFAEHGRWTFDAEGGFFRDSGRNTAGYGGVTALWHVGRGFQLGGALALLKSSTYNDNDLFIAPLPMVGYDVGPVTLNLTYFPRISGVNEVAALGFWVTVWPERF